MTENERRQAQTRKAREASAAVRRRRYEERLADILRTRGWNCTPPQSAQ